MRRLSMLLLPFAAACGDDPVAPCDREHACEVTGVDLSILSVTPRWAADQRYDDAVDARVVAPGDTVLVDVVVVNRGTESSPDSVVLNGWIRDEDRQLEASADVPILDMGDRVTLRLPFQVPSGPRFRRWHGGETIYDIGGFEVTKLGSILHEDVDLTNNLAGPVRVHTRAPILAISLDATPDTMWGSRPYPSTLQVRNLSPFVAFQDSLPLVFCAVEFAHGHCQMRITDSFGATHVGWVPAGADRTFPAMLEFTSASLPYFTASTFAGILPCNEPVGGDPLRCHVPEELEPVADFSTVLIPDLLAECAPPVLGSGDVLDVQSAGCRHAIGDEAGYDHAVAAFEGAPGECWRADVVSGEPGLVVMTDTRLEFLPRDTARDCMGVQKEGTHYLIVRPWGAAAELETGEILLQRVDPSTTT